MMHPRAYLWTIIAGPLLGLFLGTGTNGVPGLWADDTAGRSNRLLLRDGGWVNGEWLTAGQSADDGPAEAVPDEDGPRQILWASPAFEQPIRVDVDRVRRIAIEQDDAVEAAGDEFGFDLGRRGRIFGRLKRITPEAVVIETPLQELRIPRDTLTQMVRSSPERRQVRFASLDEPERVEAWSFDGEGNRLDWDQPALSQRPVDPRHRQAIAEALSIPETLLPEDDLAGLIERIRKEVGQYVDLDLDGRSLIRLEVRWEDIPELDIAVGIDHQHQAYQNAFRLQVWDGELVLFREMANDVRLVPLLSAKSFTVSRHWSLTIDLDPARGRFAVHDASGNLLGEITTPVAGDAWGSGARLWTGDRTRVTAFSAESDAWSSLQNRDLRLPVAPPLVRLTSGRAIGGTVLSYEAEDRQVALNSDADANGGSAVSERNDDRATPSAIEFERWDQWLLRDTASESYETAPPIRPGGAGSWRVVTADGWRLNGNAFEIGDRSIELGVPEIDGPIRIPLDKVRSIVWAEQPAAAEGSPEQGSGARRQGEEVGGEAALGRLTAEGLSLRGRIASVDESPPGNGLPWLIAGSSRPIRLKPDVAAQVVFPGRVSAWARDEPAAAKPAARGAAVRVEADPIVMGGGLLGGIFGGGGGMRRVVIANQKGRRTSSDPPAAESRVLFLRSGDTIPAEITSIDATGVHFDSPTIDQGFVPHERVQSVILRELDRPKQIDTTTRDRLLLIPRAARDDPPTHLVCSTSGDFVRGRLESVDDRFVRMEVRLESLRIPRDQVAQIFWLHPQAPVDRGGDQAIANSADDPAATDGRGDGRPAASPLEVGDLRGPSSDQEGRRNGAVPLRMQAWRGDGTRLSFEFRDCVDGTTILGFDPDLGDCQVRLEELDRLLIGAAISDVPPGSAFADWRPHHAPLPKAFLPGQPEGAGAGDDGIRSAMVGQDAPPFELETLAGPRYRLADARGQVVVLDFWASWCGPCIQAMPVIDQVVREFDPGEVSLVAVNLQEEPQTIRSTLERLGLEPTVALDRRGAVAESYGVTAIPQTVIVGPDGKIARLYVGSHASLAESLREAIRELLDAPE